MRTVAHVEDNKEFFRYVHRKDQMGVRLVSYIKGSNMIQKWFKIFHCSGY